jgi:hypothetical protein
VLVGDGSVFGWDSESHRVITFELGGKGMMLEPCFPPAYASASDRIQEARCANLRRRDDLPLVLNDRWIMYARPRRFLAPQRGPAEVPVLTVSYEAADPAVYDIEERTGTARVGVSRFGRPYPQDWAAWAPPAPPPIRDGYGYRGPLGDPRASGVNERIVRTWRYEGYGQGGLLAVDNAGCRDTYLRVRIDGPVQNPILVNMTTFERLELNLTLGPSDWLDIDFRTGTVLLNGAVSRYYAVTRESSWFSVGPGTTFINFLARGEVTPALLTAWWRSAW